MISVFSENPENDLWRELLQFSYEANINRYLSKKGLHANGETINCIVGYSYKQTNIIEPPKMQTFKFLRCYCIMAQQICSTEWLICLVVEKTL